MIDPEPPRDGKYARFERERRFLLAAPPEPARVTATRLINDRYLRGTRLRLRRVERPDLGTVEYKLTQKIPLEASSAVRPWGVQGSITNTYLSSEEYALIVTLPAAALSKVRLSVPPLGVDVFDGPRLGLVLAEAEFASDDAARDFVAPAGCVAEVTHDPRFTGGQLVVVTRSQLRGWLAGFGIELES